MLISYNSYIQVAKIGAKAFSTNTAEAFLFCERQKQFVCKLERSQLTDSRVFDFLHVSLALKLDAVRLNNEHRDLALVLFSPSFTVKGKKNIISEKTCEQNE